MGYKGGVSSKRIGCTTRRSNVNDMLQLCTEFQFGTVDHSGRTAGIANQHNHIALIQHGYKLIVF